MKTKTKKSKAPEPLPVKSPAPPKQESKLDSLQLADGKIPESDIKRLKELEDLMGIKKFNPFGTNNVDILKERLADMNLADLQVMCEKVGLFASGSRSEIKEKLLREFKSTVRGSFSVPDSKQFQFDMTNPKHKKVHDYLKGI